jgi:anti-anti-sigma factor
MIEAFHPSNRNRPDIEVPPLDLFHCDVVFRDEHAVISVHGDVDLATAPALLREAFATLALPISALTMDLEGTTFLDSSGLDVLLQVQRRGRELGITVGLEAVPRQALRVIEITGLTELLDAHA